MIPLCTVQLAGYPLRIYASPRPKPDHPWASFTDLAALAEWNEAAQQERWSELRQQQPEMTYEMSNGTRLIAQSLVGGLFTTWLQTGSKTAQLLLDEWQDAWTKTFEAQYAHLPRSEWLKIMRAAHLQNIPMVPNVKTVN